MEFNRKELKSICEKHKVKTLYLFGSFAKKEANAESDIDFLVSFSEVELYDYFDNYLALKESLEKAYQRKVDLLEEQTLKNPFLKENIEESKILLYG